MPTELTRYTFENAPVRVIDRNGEFWFVAKDIADALGYAWAGSSTIRHVPDEWRGVDSVLTPSGAQEMAVLSEQGLYFFLGRSDKPKALPFQKWLASDVVPSIRKTGSYSLRPATKPVTETEALLMAIQNLQQTVQILHDHGKKIQRIEDNVTTISHRVDSLDTANIEGDLRQRFEKMISRYAWAAGIKYPEAWKRFDQAYNTAFRANLTALRHNYAERNGLKAVTRPEYFERVGQLPDAIRIADKMLASVKREGA